MTSSDTARLVDLDKRFVWHPFTQMAEWNDGEPLVIERAEGNYLIDSEGRRYLDGVASIWTNVHGHCRPELNEAIIAQLERVAHSTLLGLANAPSVLLAERLVRLAPGRLGKVFYSDSGSTAVEIALKQAFQYWQLIGRREKHRFVKLEHAYHGDTLGAVAVGGIDLFHQVFEPLLPGGERASLTAPSPCPRPGESAGRACERGLAAVEGLLAEHSREVAAFIIEPLMQGAGGMLAQPEGYLRGVADLCAKYEVLLIADEVATGFGRTGTFFACEQEGVEPDFLCVAKGLSGGYLPLAATLTTDEIYRAFLGPRSALKAFFHGHTYTGNPVACAAAIASLDLFERDRVLERLPGLIEGLAGELEKRLGGHPNVGEIRQRGLMVGIELLEDRSTDQAFAPDRFIGARVCEAARAHGVIVRPLGDVVVLMPPLSVTAEEIRTLVAAVADATTEVCSRS
jgi:adenosylmethionine-8-amino-7-oxononanoate aminotransferase